MSFSEKSLTIQWENLAKPISFQRFFTYQLSLDSLCVERNTNVWGEMHDLVDGILEDVFQISYLNSWKEKYFPYSVKHIPDLSFKEKPITCMAVTSDGTTLLAGSGNVLLLVNTSTMKIEDKWQNSDAAKITKIDTILLRDVMVIVILDDHGLLQIFMYHNSTFNLMEAMPEDVRGSITIFDFYLLMKYSGIIIIERSQDVHCIQIYKIPLDFWMKEIIHKHHRGKHKASIITTIHQFIEDPKCPVVFQMESSVSNKDNPLHSEVSPRITASVEKEISRIPSILICKPWPKFVGAKDMESWCLITWWSGTNQLLFYVGCIAAERGFPEKPQIVWYHSDVILNCAVSDDSRIVAVTLVNGLVVIRNHGTGIVRRLFRLAVAGQLGGIWFIPTFTDSQITELVAVSSDTESTAARTTEKDFTTKSSVASFASSSVTLPEPVITYKDINECEKNKELFIEIEEKQKYLKTITLPSEDEISSVSVREESLETSVPESTVSVEEEEEEEEEEGEEEDEEQVAAESLVPEISFHLPEIDMMPIQSSVLGDLASLHRLQSFQQSALSTAHLLPDKSMMLPALSSSGYSGGSLGKLSALSSKSVEESESVITTDVDEVIEIRSCPSILKKIDPPAHRLVVAVKDGSLWIIDCDLKVDNFLMQALPTSSYGEEIGSVQVVFCHPNQFFAVTKSGRIYLLDIFAVQPAKEIIIDAEQLLDPGNLLVKLNISGKSAYVRGMNRKTECSDLLVVDLFPLFTQKACCDIEMKMKEIIVEKEIKDKMGNDMFGIISIQEDFERETIEDLLNMFRITIREKTTKSTCTATKTSR